MKVGMRRAGGASQGLPPEIAAHCRRQVFCSRVSGRPSRDLRYSASRDLSAYDVAESRSFANLGKHHPPSASRQVFVRASGAAGRLTD